MSGLKHAFGELLARFLNPRVRLPTDPIPQAWFDLVRRHVPLAARLTLADRDRLYRLMQVFLADVGIEGCAGLEVTEEMRVTIAAQACLLLLRMEFPKYTRVRRVLVYPTSFVPKTAALHRTGQIVPPEVPLLGQAWQTGVVVLGWDAVQRGAVSPIDGENVVLHEFAHMLDAEDGSMDGVPVLDSKSSYRVWATLLADRFAEHVSRTEAGEATTLNAYGATNRAEFFAVATEAFFERPVALRRGEPRLYELLMSFFKFDPASMAAEPDEGGDWELDAR
jgi:Mlc titration factor MtfA (ptsG expression regulator)